MDPDQYRPEKPIKCDGCPHKDLFMRGRTNWICVGFPNLRFCSFSCAAAYFKKKAGKMTKAEDRKALKF